MTDKFFKQLLQYRDELISQAFVEEIMNAVFRFEFTRTMIIVSCSVLGLLLLSFADLTQVDLLSNFNFSAIISELENVSAEPIGAIMFVMVLSLCVWIISLEQ
jgi:hypothetical protein